MPCLPAAVIHSLHRVFMEIWSGVVEKGEAAARALSPRADVRPQAGLPLYFLESLV